MGLRRFFIRSWFNIKRWTNKYVNIAYSVIKESFRVASPQAIAIIWSVVRSVGALNISGSDKRDKAVSEIKSSLKKAKIEFSSWFINLWLEIFAGFINKVKED